MSAILPIPKIPITVRPATMEDLPFIDALQKKHTKQVGWMPTKQLEGKIGAGHVLIAEEPSPLPSPCVQGEGDRRVGYCIGNDQYFKRDDVGIIYQMNVVPGKQRGFVGATLLKAMFDRAAYGCRLFCLWCAQDIEANYFWESLGFVPLAFRAGSAKKSRVHIFWQKRIRQDDTATPYWFPAQTSSGSIREDRLVLPIPPGKHWSDEMPRILPSEGSTKLHDPQAGSPNHKQIPSIKKKIQNGEAPTLLPPTQRAVLFGAPSDRPPINSPDNPREQVQDQQPVKKEKAPRKPKAKNDPKLVAAARELRDRWLEQVNANPAGIESQAKYEVTRQIEANPRSITGAGAGVPLLAA